MSRTDAILSVAVAGRDADLLVDAVYFVLGSRLETPLLRRARATDQALLNERNLHPKWHSLLRSATGDADLDEEIAEFLARKAESSVGWNLFGPQYEVRAALIVDAFKKHLLDRIRRDARTSEVLQPEGWDGESFAEFGGGVDGNIQQDAAAESVDLGRLVENKAFLHASQQLLRDLPDLRRFLALSDEGLKLRQIAAELKISEDTLANRRKEWGLLGGRETTTPVARLLATLPAYDPTSAPAMYRAAFGILCSLALSMDGGATPERTHG